MKKYIVKIFDKENMIIQFITDDFKEALDVANEYVDSKYVVKIFKSDELPNN